VVEHEVDVIVRVADGDSFLARLKAETATPFEKEGLYEQRTYRPLKLAFRPRAP
jgi:hypothetical protein